MVWMGKSGADFIRVHTVDSCLRILVRQLCYLTMIYLILMVYVKVMVLYLILKIWQIVTSRSGLQFLTLSQSTLSFLSNNRMEKYFKIFSIRINKPIILLLQGCFKISQETVRFQSAEYHDCVFSSWWAWLQESGRVWAPYWANNSHLSTITLEQKWNRQHN